MYQVREELRFLSSSIGSSHKQEMEEEEEARACVGSRSDTRVLNEAELGMGEGRAQILRQGPLC